MSSTPFISHSINGYSRYEIPESVAFTATPGILYPVRCDFMNARDVRYIQCGTVIRTNPALLPTFTPFRVSLHRFFVPMQLYHPEMRVNSAKFDFQTLSTNCIGLLNSTVGRDDATTPAAYDESKYFFGRSLMFFLGLASGKRLLGSVDPFKPTPSSQAVSSVASLGNDPLGVAYANADPILAYYDIIRSYYSFSQIGTLSLAMPCPAADVSGSFAVPTPGTNLGVAAPTEASASNAIPVGVKGAYWRQFIGLLEPFDDFFESTFYPKRGESRGLYYDRTPFVCEMVNSSLRSRVTRSDEQITNVWNNLFVREVIPEGDLTYQSYIPLKSWWVPYLPFGVAPAVADRYSRLLPLADSDDVSISSISTVRGLAFAAKLQAYKDLLSSGGSRFTDWLMTFFAAKVSHVDRPILVYSSSFYMNSSPIFSQQGGDSLGTYAGVIQGQDSFGKKAQRYSFDEPGYLMDIFSIRPLYFWSGIQKDYSRYDKLDYFNPIFNEVGYETIPGWVFGNLKAVATNVAVAKQPCYNEFRSSYDRVLGDMALVPGYDYGVSTPILSTWVQQRVNLLEAGENSVSDYLARTYFTDVDQSNSVFASRAEDNFFVNLYYNVTSKSLVSKNFATNLATR